MLFRSHGITRDENLMTRNDGHGFINNWILVLIIELQIFSVHWDVVK